MNKLSLNTDLDKAIKKYEKQFESLQSRGFEDDLQNVVNELGLMTLTALNDFKKAILENT